MFLFMTDTDALMSLLVFVVSVMPEYVYYLLSETYIFLFRSLFKKKAIWT